MYINPEKIANARVASQSHPNRTYKNNACFTAKKKYIYRIECGGKCEHRMSEREKEKNNSEENQSSKTICAYNVCVCVL